MLKKHAKSIAAIILFAATTTLTACAVTRYKFSYEQAGRPLSTSETLVLREASALMASRGLKSEALLTDQLIAKGIWRTAKPNDIYMQGSENSDNTPFAYTMFNGKKPNAIVLAPRFFTAITTTGRAALMIHELGHYRAYLKTGKSTELDGYKPEYDTHEKLELTERDGIVYYSMLDGVAEYVVPKLPVYKTYPDVQAYIATP